ncbi:MAG: amino acid dehydrogenase [Lutibacter sp.]|nr:MAG: amino acid dehydrogenase [Lutibacter sp.]
MKKEVVIIGGGIIGLSAAYYLLKEGHTVTVIDQSDISSGASFVNAGFISPSHVIPLAAPGMVTMGIKMMFNRASPFYLKPRFDLDLIKWAWMFKKSATAKHVREAAPIIKNFTVFSRELFEEMKGSMPFDFHLERKGLLMCYQTSKFEEKEAKIAEAARYEGLEVLHIEKSKLKGMEPEMDAEGAFYYVDDSQSTPDDFMKSFYKYLKSSGVQFITNEEVLGFERNSNKITNLITNKQQVKFDELVVASGSWSPILAKKLGVKMLVQAGKGYRINVNRKTGIKYPAILAELNTAVSPMDGFTRFGGTMEIAGINEKINMGRVKAIAKAAHTFYPNVTITKQEMEGAACGLRPVSPDGLPFIGRANSISNVCFATGHAMMGWSQAHATGKLVSEILSNKKPSLNIVPFSVERFN